MSIHPTPPKTRPPISAHFEPKSCIPKALVTCALPSGSLRGSTGSNICQWREAANAASTARVQKQQKDADYITYRVEADGKKIFSEALNTMVEQNRAQWREGGQILEDQIVAEETLRRIQAARQTKAQVAAEEKLRRMRAVHQSMEADYSCLEKIYEIVREADYFIKEFIKHPRELNTTFYGLNELMADDSEHKQEVTKHVIDMRLLQDKINKCTPEMTQCMRDHSIRLTYETIEYVYDQVTGRRSAE